MIIDLNYDLYTLLLRDNALLLRPKSEHSNRAYLNSTLLWENIGLKYIDSRSGGVRSFKVINKKLYDKHNQKLMTSILSEKFSKESP
jgi:hypothetical protein